MADLPVSLTQPALPHQRHLHTADVTVVGAGPAGALLAYLLARHGLRVVLVEKASLPRTKPCGGGLNQKTVELLPFSIDEVVERVTSRLVFTHRLRWPFTRTYPAPLVTLVTRCHFDYFLVQQAVEAGAHIYDNCRVTQLSTAPRRFTITAATATWHSRYMAFADGAKGTLRRQLGFPATMPHDIGLDLDVEATPNCPWRPDTLYIDWGTHPQSYAWAFPKADHWSIGVKGLPASGPVLSHYLRRFMQRWQLRPGADRLRYLAYMLPTRSPGMPLVRGRALLLGDAAGLLEPFTGEGIYYAVRSAHLAAEALLPASLTDTSPQSYAVAVEKEIMPELLGGRALQQLFDAYPGVLHLLVRSLPRPWRALAKIMRGERGFADVARILHRHASLVRLALRIRESI